MEEPGSYEPAVAGCAAVVHMASPLIFVKPGQERELLIGPAVRLVEAVLAAVEKTRSVKRVVMTSSIGTSCGLCRL